jgi:flagellin
LAGQDAFLPHQLKQADELRKAMPARINHNVHLKQIQRNLSVHHADAARQIEHLSSGLRVSRPSDDPASLAQADGIRSELRSLSEGRRNIQQTFSLLQVADGSLNEIAAMVNRMQALAIQAGSSVSSGEDRINLNSEFAVLRLEIDRIAGATTYNGKNLLTGFNSELNSASTAIERTDITGVSRVRTTGAEPGVYTFDDEQGLDREITLGNGVVSQTVSLQGPLSGSGVPPEGHVVVDFDLLGIQVTLSGRDAVGGGGGAYDDGDLDGHTILVDGTDKLTFQVGPAGTSNDVAEISMSDMRATGTTLNLADVSLLTIGDAQTALSFIQQAQAEVVATATASLLFKTASR